MSPKIIIPIYNDSSKYRLIQSRWNKDLRCNVDEKPMILLNNNWPIKTSIRIDEEGLTVLTCQYHDWGEDKLSLFSPQSPNGNILNAQQLDQLASCVKIPQISTPTKAMAYCTNYLWFNVVMVFPELTTWTSLHIVILARLLSFFWCMRIQKLLDGMIFTYYYNKKLHQNKYHLN